MRLFGRALIRARLPLRYSEGFNPHPRLSLPLPRPVGTAADDEVLVAELTSELPAELLVRRLAEQLPDGLTVRSAALLPDGVFPQARAATYEVDLSGPLASELPGRIDALLRQERVPVDRYRADGERVKGLDIRPYLRELHLKGTRLTMRLGIDQRGTAKPSEVLAALGLDAVGLMHRVRRLSADWDPPLSAGADNRVRHA